MKLEDEPFQSPEEMRAQTQEYVMAVAMAHPELVPLDKDIFDPYPTPYTKKDGAIALILQEVSKATHISIKELLGDSRLKKTVRARWEIYRRAKNAGYSLAEIGRRMNKDHTTVMHGLKRLAKS
jgi:chromosomal replication initiation ATPase DnaA